MPQLAQTRTAGGMWGAISSPQKGSPPPPRVPEVLFDSSAFEGAGGLRGWLLKAQFMSGAFPRLGVRCVTTRMANGDWGLLILDGFDVQAIDKAPQSAALLNQRNLDRAVYQQNGWLDVVEPELPGNALGGPMTAWLAAGDSTLCTVNDQAAPTKLGIGNIDCTANLAGQYATPTVPYRGLAYTPQLAPTDLAVLRQTPYIDNVEIILPVDPQNDPLGYGAKAKGFHVFGRMNRYTRTVTITKTKFMGWGTKELRDAFLQDPQASIKFLEQVLAGLVEIFAGIVTDNPVLIVGGLVTIVSAAYDFSQYANGQQIALTGSVKPGGALDKQASHAKELNKGGATKYDRTWLIWGATTVAGVLLKNVL